MTAALPRAARPRRALPPVSVDLFAGGGGASLGIEWALGRSPVLAVNHNADAIAMHAANHADTEHACEAIERVDPARTHALIGKRKVALLWASPDCTHHSKAKGGKPRDRGLRALAWHVVVWVRALSPRVLILENVPEFVGWGPVDEDGQPILEKKGEDFRQFVASLQLLGYHVEYRILCAADYGAPTSRRRLFLIARRDAAPAWPEPTHGAGRSLPWRTAAECIDWSIPCPSIFERATPLADATNRRIAEGIMRYVVKSARPYIVRLPASDLVAPSLVRIGNGEREGQRPRCEDIEAPLTTVVASGGKHALVAAYLAKHFTGAVGSDLRVPMGTVTAIDHHSLVAASLTKFYGTARTGADIGQPMPTVTATGQHIGLVASFLTKYYKTGIGQSLHTPIDTIVSKDRFGLVTVTIDGEDYALADIGMRMLTPRELARAQGFPDSYMLTGTKTSQIARIGNSVCPPIVRALVAAQFGIPLSPPAQATA